MLHVATRPAPLAIATASLLVVLLCLGGPVSAQVLKVSGSGGSYGTLGPGASRGASLLLGLEFVFAREKKTDPALIYAITSRVPESVMITSLT